MLEQGTEEINVVVAGSAMQSIIQVCDKNEDNDKDKPLLSTYTVSTQEKSLPAIVPVNIKGHTLWAFLDTGSGHNFISCDAVRKLKLEPARHETHEVLTINGYKTTHMPIFIKLALTLLMGMFEKGYS